jgi:hypothetical protein
VLCQFCAYFQTALKAQLLKPEMVCLKGHSQINCMQSVSNGYVVSGMYIISSSLSGKERIANHLVIVMVCAEQAGLASQFLQISDALFFLCLIQAFNFVFQIVPHFVLEMSTSITSYIIMIISIHL